MATDSVNLPAGFQLEDQASSPKLPPGFELEDQTSKSSPQPTQTAPQSFMGKVSDAVGNNALGPLGTAAQGAKSATSILSKVSNAFPVSVSQGVQDTASSFFRGARALGAGGADYASKLIQGQNTPKSLFSSIDATKQAYQPNYQPQTLPQKVGAFVGENAPVAAATALSPAVGGPMALMAQQAQSGKVSPVPLAMGLLSKVSGGAGKVTQDIGQTGIQTGQKMANAVTGVMPNTLARFVNKFSPTGNPVEAGEAMGQKLINDGILEGDDAKDFFNNVQDKANSAGQAVGDSLKAIHDEAGKYGQVNNPLQLNAQTVLKPLQDQASTLKQGILSGTRSMGTPTNQVLASLQDTADKNGGSLNFDDIEAARKEVGQLLSQTPQTSPKYAQYSQLYGALADTRNKAVDQIASNAQNPQLASNLQKANSEYHFYDSVLHDVTKSALKEGVGGQGLASAISGKMGSLGALYALSKGEFGRAATLGIGGKIIPMLENEMGSSVAKDAVKMGQSVKNFGSNIQGISKAASTGIDLSNMQPSQPLDKETAKQLLEQAGGDPDKARELARLKRYQF